MNIALVLMAPQRN